jgi:hypothetical protein
VEQVPRPSSRTSRHPSGPRSCRRAGSARGGPPHGSHAPPGTRTAAPSPLQGRAGSRAGSPRPSSGSWHLLSRSRQPWAAFSTGVWRSSPRSCGPDPPRSSPARPPGREGCVPVTAARSARATPPPAKAHRALERLCAVQKALFHLHTYRHLWGLASGGGPLQHVGVAHHRSAAVDPQRLLEAGNHDEKPDCPGLEDVQQRIEAAIARPLGYHERFSSSTSTNPGP